MVFRWHIKCIYLLIFYTSTHIFMNNYVRNSPDINPIEHLRNMTGCNMFKTFTCDSPKLKYLPLKKFGIISIQYFLCVYSVKFLGATETCICITKGVKYVNFCIMNRRLSTSTNWAIRYILLSIMEKNN